MIRRPEAGPERLSMIVFYEEGAFYYIVLPIVAQLQL
jgi:hypothetical protein